MTDSLKNDDNAASAVLIRVFAGSGANGPIFEELPAQALGDEQYRLLKSPGLAANLAKGDLIRLPSEPVHPEVLERGGNFCIQIYDAPAELQAKLEMLDADIQDSLNGSLDGAHQGNLAFTVPASNGLAVIDEYFDALKQAWGCEWYYGNIYQNLDDPTDETLLDWWRNFATPNRLH